MLGAMDAQAPHYPAHWEADVVLTDGALAHVRPVHPDDGDRLRRFYAGVSEEALFYRFFGNHASQVDVEIAELLVSDHTDDVGLVLTIRGEIVALVRYVVLPSTNAERVADVAFLVRDDQQGRGMSSILLEHLAEVGRERDVDRFSAEILPANRRMIRVFRDAGYAVSPQLSDGNVVLDFPIAGTSEARSIMEQRERRSESAAIRRLVQPTSLGLVGEPDEVSALEARLAELGYAGTVATASAISDLPDGIDLVVAPGRTDPVASLEAASERNARGLLLLARPAGPETSLDEANAVLARARELGIRTLGPAALALVNTEDGVRLNVSPTAAPRQGVVGMFTQSAGVGTIMLGKALSMGLGLTTFISTGSYADVTANDVMHFWAEDERTSVCLLSLDRIGNPRKFLRIIRELARRKPVVVFTPSRALRSARWDLTHELPSAPPEALDQVIEATGAIVVRQREEMFDVARILARQPVPAGRRVKVISNSPGLVDHAAQAAGRWDLRTVDPVVVADDDVVPAVTEAVRASLDDADVDIIMAGLIETSRPERLMELRDALEVITAERPDKTIVGVFVGFGPTMTPAKGVDGPGRLPSFSSYADALHALSAVIDGDTRRATSIAGAEPNEELTTASEDRERARALVEAVLAENPDGRQATDAETTELLAAYGLELLASVPVTTLEEALAAAEDFGWDVVLKATHRAARGRPDMPNVTRHLGDADELGRAWEQLSLLATELSAKDVSEILPVVQPTVAQGVPLSVRAIEDRALGPMVSVGVAGPPSELLGDMVWRAAPVDAEGGLAMLKSLRAVPLLEGYRGSPPAHWYSIVSMLVRLSQLKDDLPEVVEVDLTPVLAGPDAVTIVGARLRIAPALTVRDPLARRT